MSEMPTYYDIQRILSEAGAKMVSTIRLETHADSGNSVAALRDDSALLEYGRPGTLAIVNDQTRPTRTADVLRECGLTCDVLVATGAHRAPYDSELKRICGALASRRRVRIHDARRSTCKFLGTTSRGTPVELNDLLFSYERLLIIGSVEPHFFAGFTGGRKAFLPGTAGYKTIEKNHALFFEPGATILNLEGNPVHEDMLEAAFMVDTPTLAVNMVLDAAGGVLGVFTGSLTRSFTQAVDLATQYYTARIDELVDVVIAWANPPMDIDLYQAQKAVYNAARVLKPGGLLVLVAECRDGIGPPAYHRLLSEGPTPSDVIRRTKEDYHLGLHKAASLAEVLKKNRLCIVSKLDHDAIVRVGAYAWDPEAIDKKLRSTLERRMSIVLMPHASFTVPVSKDVTNHKRNHSKEL